MGASDVLEGVRVLVAEDDGVVALDLAATLEGFGCVVLGPAPTVAETLALLAGGERPDAALLDLGLQDGWSGPAAEALAAAGVPFALTTGHDRSSLDAPALRAAPCLEKPFGCDDLRGMMLELIRPSPPGSR
jgi:CheY-like chemotaxis protein